MTGETVLNLGQRCPEPPETALQALRKAVEECAQRDRWSRMLSFKINMVLEELTTNAISHGRTEPGRTPDMRIAISSQRERVTVRFSDNGVPFNPLKDAPPPPDRNGDQEEISVGGVGIHLVRSTMETLSYAREAGTNVLLMTIRRE
jgi:anti-sigma regulatory factor (Ser/Thr protein kinase)